MSAYHQVITMALIKIIVGNSWKCIFQVCKFQNSFPLERFLVPGHLCFIILLKHIVVYSVGFLYM